MPSENEKLKTDVKEFDKLVQLLPFEPYMIPLQRHGKDPDVPKGESWKDPKYKLTTPQACERLRQGLNVGIVATGSDLALFDHDDPAKFVFSKETLTVKTRNGKLHKYFLNGGDVENADGKGQYANCGEVRAKWKYVVAPGSFVPSDSAEGDGLYRVIEAKPLATLYGKELPAEFQPAQKSAKDVHVQSVALAGSFRNQYGWSLEDIRERDDKLGGLLNNSDAGYPSASEADMATLSKLLYWGYNESEAAEILKRFRSRDKLDRADYIQNTLGKIGKTDSIANYVDVKRWNPKHGYKNEAQPVDVNHFATLSVGDMQVTPILTGFESIHPAIGAFNDTAFVGVWLSCEIVETKKEKKTGKQKQQQRFDDLLYLVTSEREAILANDLELRGHGWRLSYKPLKLKNPWRLKSILSYLKNEPCELATLLSDIVRKYRQYIDFSDERSYLFHALWDIGTYFHFLFKTYPYLYIGGIKRTGKTKTLTLHSCVAHNAFFSNNMSTSSIYRLIQNARGTLIIDETEKLRNPERALEFRSILLAGYKKGAVVYRVEKTKKDVLVPESFEIFSPKIMANITGIEDVMEDRCIAEIMKRGINLKVVNVEIDTESLIWAELRDRLYRFFLANWNAVLEVYQQIGVCSELTELVNLLGVTLKNSHLANLHLLSARELELWKPILALAKFFDVTLAKFTCSLNTLSTPEKSEANSKTSTLSSMMLELGVDKAAQKNVENLTETGEVILVQVLSGMVAEDNFYKVKDIRDRMSKQFDEEQKWITTRWVGNALRRLGFTEKRRVGTGYEYKLTKAEIADQCNRLNIENTGTDKNEMLKKIKTLKYNAEGIDKRECSFCGIEKMTGWVAVTFKDENLPICDDCRKIWEASNG